MKKISLERMNAERFDKAADPLTERERKRRKYQRAYMRRWRLRKKVQAKVKAADDALKLEQHAALVRIYGDKWIPG